MKVHTAWQTHLVDSWWSCINIYTPYWLRVGFSVNKWDLSALKNFWHSKFLKLQPGSMDIEQGQTREVHHSFRNAPKNVTPIWFDTWNFVFSGPVDQFHGFTPLSLSNRSIQIHWRVLAIQIKIFQSKKKRWNTWRIETNLRTSSPFSTFLFEIMIIFCSFSKVTTSATQFG